MVAKCIKLIFIIWIYLANFCDEANISKLGLFQCPFTCSRIYYILVPSAGKYFVFTINAIKTDFREGIFPRRM